MKSTVWMLLIMLLAIAACKKDEVKRPATSNGIEYSDFGNREVKANQSVVADLDKDGSKDFYLFTMLVGDALLERDYLRYHLAGSFYNFFPVNENEESPMLNKGDSITANAFEGYNWYNASQILLAQKVTTMNPPPFWEGQWKEASHRYMPMRIQKGNDFYYGWIELSFDTATEKITLHKGAINRDANKGVKAGY